MHTRVCTSTNNKRQSKRHSIEIALYFGSNTIYILSTEPSIPSPKPYIFSQNSPTYSAKQALYFIERALRFTTRALSSIKRALRCIKTPSNSCFLLIDSRYTVCDPRMDGAHAHSDTHTHALSLSLSISFFPTQTHTLSLSPTHTLSFYFSFSFFSLPPPPSPRPPPSSLPPSAHTLGGRRGGWSRVGSGCGEQWGFAFVAGIGLCSSLSRSGVHAFMRDPTHSFATPLFHARPQSFISDTT